jgi:NADH:ubiquinone oxidoreductase subunit D
VFTAKEGDCFARASVRMRELRESIRVVRAMIDNLPEGPLCGGKTVRQPTQIKIARGQAYAAVESPRGELGTYVVAGGGVGKGGVPDGTAPWRLKIRAPSLHALSALPYILPGHTVSDAVAVLGSLDPIMGEVDR